MEETNKVKPYFQWPVGMECRRSQRDCFSYSKDGQCYGRACPFNGIIGKNGVVKKDE